MYGHTMMKCAPPTVSMLGSISGIGHVSRTRTILILFLYYSRDRSAGMCRILQLCMVITYSKSMDQPGKVANLVRSQLNRENDYFPVPVRA